ncbi:MULTISPECIES: ATP-binding cassette domain-containing protein [unclassified Microbacterium]|uniref:ATP-binding cassette domain-containing protein n=1 Tax=unclassified Microbacterium TaxID=2609290 RepID=UPI0038684FB7
MTPSPRRPHDHVLTMRGVDKRFGAVRALTSVDFHVREGEVVALVGDNGAGKSTLVKILAGVHPLDAGTIELDGDVVHITDPADAQALGIATIFQDLALCENLDVVGNLWLGRELTVQGRLDEVEMEQRTWLLLRELGATLPSVRVPVSTLSGGQRQTVAIARSLIGDPRIVILDEPTAALGVTQSAEVLNLIERLRDRGHGVILISHNLTDVLAVADRIVALRLGRNNGDFDAEDATSELLIAAITGAIGPAPSPSAPPRAASSRDDRPAAPVIPLAGTRRPPETRR